MTKTQNSKSAGVSKYVIVAVFLVAAFFGAYRFANASNSAARTNPSAGGVAAVPAGTSSDTPACACCGSSAPTKDGVTGDVTEGAATVTGDVQSIDIDLSKGYYDPNVIVLKAGVPAEITFGQSSGCTAQVFSEDLGFSEDLSSGPKTVKLPALAAGEYTFSCGMQMVFGKIVVK